MLVKILYDFYFRSRFRNIYSNFSYFEIFEKGVDLLLQLCNTREISIEIWKKVKMYSIYLPLSNQVFNYFSGFHNWKPTYLKLLQISSLFCPDKQLNIFE